MLQGWTTPTPANQKWDEGPRLFVVRKAGQALAPGAPAQGFA